MYFKIEDDKEKIIYTIIYDDKVRRIFVENNKEIQVGSIVHARVKNVDTNRNFSFIQLDGEDGFYNAADLKAGEDYFFNVRKKPSGEKGYKLDRNIKIKIKGAIGFPLGKEFYNNPMEKITGFPVKSKADDPDLARELKSTWEGILKEQSRLPIPKVVYREASESEKYIEKYQEDLGDHAAMLRAMANTPELTGRIIECEEGSLIIDSKDHFTFVDFNTDDYSKSYNRDLNHLDLNEKLLIEAIRILSLRNIEGMILIDILKLKDYGDFIKITKNILKSQGYYFHDITKLELMEITRRKTGRKYIDQDIINKIMGI